MSIRARDQCRGPFIWYNNYMAIKPKCDKCKKELKEFGAILLSPPNAKNRVIKFHICKKCYGEMVKGLTK